jgi:GTPase
MNYFKLKWHAAWLFDWYKFTCNLLLDDWSAENGNEIEAEEKSGSGSNSCEDVCEEKPKEHVNIVFIGHVDAGKSTIGGHIM